MSNITYSVVGRAYERTLVRKAFWKSVVLPVVLSSVEVVTWNKTEKERLQKIENGIWKKILKAPSWVARAALQGEVGSTSVHVRDITGTLLFLKYMMGSENRIMRIIVEKMKRGVGGK